jgi:RNA polymerase sigma-70 factor (ECF subfamily)
LTTVNVELSPKFEDRVWQLRPQLKGYANTLVRNCDVDDLVSEVIARAIHKQHLYKESNLRAWLFTLMHNLWVTKVRQELTMSTIISSNLIELDVASCDNPMSGVILRDLDNALNQLNSDIKVVLILIGVDGLSYNAAAKLLGIPSGTIRSRLSRGRQQLKKLMDLEGE